MPLLVIPITDYNSKVSVVIGTNVLNLFKYDMSENTFGKIPKAWNVAMSSLTSENTSLVHSTNKRVVKLMPMSIKTMSGMVSAQGDTGSIVVTENLDCDLSDRVKLLKLSQNLSYVDLVMSRLYAISILSMIVFNL